MAKLYTTVNFFQKNTFTFLSRNMNLDLFWPGLIYDILCNSDNCVYSFHFFSNAVHRHIPFFNQCVNVNESIDNRSVGCSLLDRTMIQNCFCLYFKRRISQWFHIVLLRFEIIVKSSQMKPISPCNIHSVVFCSLPIYLDV